MLSAKEEELLRSRQPLFKEWYLETIVGEGSSGTVYKITDHNGNHCALKIIPVTAVDEMDTIHLQEQDFNAKRKYLEDMSNEILAEVRVMQTLEDHAGIVKYHAYDVIADADSFVYLILIKMDLLQPLHKVLRMRDTEFAEEEVVTMGIDLLTSLSECGKHHIIHRDIKPSNVFVTEDDRYLLGDFGSARLLKKTMMASHKGTLCYMAPEIASGQSYNATVDIYSLGIMLYQLLNNRKLPFLNTDSKFSDIESAVEKRLSGATLPYPEKADKELGKIICKMCAFSPKDRYATPKDCITAFENYRMYGKTEPNGNLKKRLIKISMLLFAVLFLAVMIRKVPSLSEKNESADTSSEKNHSADSAVTKGSSQDIGISSGNVNSSGMIASDEKWLYYSQDYMGERGIRVSKDGTKKEVLCDYIMGDINLTTDYLFFSSQYTSPDTSKTPDFITGLYRMNKDGSNLICLDDAKVLNPVTYGKFVYYFRCENAKNTLCRIPMEGGKVETLAQFNIATYYFYPYENQLYVYDNGAAQLIALDIEDGTREVIMNEASGRFCIEDGFLYCSPPCIDGFNNKIYVFKINAASPADIDIDKAKIITFPYGIYEFNVNKGVIYASSNVTASWEKQSGKDGIWSVNRDGSNLQQIYTGNAINLQLVDQTLYFAEDSVVYTMDLNGKNRNKEEDMTMFYMLE